MYSITFVLFSVICVVWNMPLEHTELESKLEIIPKHRLSKRFINPSMMSDRLKSIDFSKIRAKRDLEEECEKLNLCKLHARSNRNFIAAFELYFVNKENARLWDHQTHSIANCNQRYSCDR